MSLLCRVGWHKGSCGYDPDRSQFDPRYNEFRMMVICSQTRTCQRCGTESFQVRHDVRDWESVSSDTESGRCARCQQRVSREKTRGRPG